MRPTLPTTTPSPARPWVATRRSPTAPSCVASAPGWRPSTQGPPPSRSTSAAPTSTSTATPCSRPRWHRTAAWCSQRRRRHQPRRQRSRRQRRRRRPRQRRRRRWLARGPRRPRRHHPRPRRRRHERRPRPSPPHRRRRAGRSGGVRLDELPEGDDVARVEFLEGEPHLVAVVAVVLTEDERVAHNAAPCGEREHHRGFALGYRPEREDAQPAQSDVERAPDDALDHETRIVEEGQHYADLDRYPCRAAALD